MKLLKRALECYKQTTIKKTREGCSRLTDEEYAKIKKRAEDALSNSTVSFTHEQAENSGHDVVDCYSASVHNGSRLLKKDGFSICAKHKKVE